MSTKLIVKGSSQSHNNSNTHKTHRHKSQVSLTLTPFTHIHITQTHHTLVTQNYLLSPSRTHNEWAENSFYRKQWHTHNEWPPRRSHRENHPASENWGDATDSSSFVHGNLCCFSVIDDHSRTKQLCFYLWLSFACPFQMVFLSILRVTFSLPFPLLTLFFCYIFLYRREKMVKKINACCVSELTHKLLLSIIFQWLFFTVTRKEYLSVWVLMSLRN